MRHSSSHRTSWARAAAVVALLTGAAFGAAFASGCGSASTGSASSLSPPPNLTAKDIVAKAESAGRKTTSSQIAFRATIDVRQAPGATASSNLGPLASGPATVSGTLATATSPVAMDLSAKVATANDGVTMSVGMRVVGGKGWMNVMGQWYTMPPEFETSLKDAQARLKTQPTDSLDLTRSLGIDPVKWARKLTLVGTEKVDGVEAYHVSAALDSTQFMNDVFKMMASPQFAKLVGATQAQQLTQNMPTAADLKDAEKVFKTVTGDAWYSTATFDLVKLAAKAVLEAPSAQEAASSGVQSAMVDIELSQSKFGEPVNVQAPASVLPWDQGPLAGMTTGTSSSSSGSSSVSDQSTLAKDAAVKEGIRSIQIGIQSYAIDHNDRYPSASEVSKRGLVDAAGNAYVDLWPMNPFTGKPMALGTGAGNYSYAVGANGFKLTGFGADGKPVMTVP